MQGLFPVLSRLLSSETPSLPATPAPPAPLSMPVLLARLSLPTACAELLLRDHELAERAVVAHQTVIARRTGELTQCLLSRAELFQTDTVAAGVAAVTMGARLLRAALEARLAAFDRDMRALLQAAVDEADKAVAVARALVEGSGAGLEAGRAREAVAAVWECFERRIAEDTLALVTATRADPGEALVFEIEKDRLVGANGDKRPPLKVGRLLRFSFRGEDPATTNPAVRVDFQPVRPPPGPQPPQLKRRASKPATTRRGLEALLHTVHHKASADGAKEKDPAAAAINRYKRTFPPSAKRVPALPASLQMTARVLQWLRPADLAKVDKRLFAVSRAAGRADVSLDGLEYEPTDGAPSPELANRVCVAGVPLDVACVSDLYACEAHIVSLFRGAADADQAALQGAYGAFPPAVTHRALYVLFQVHGDSAWRARALEPVEYRELFCVYLVRDSSLAPNAIDVLPAAAGVGGGGGGGGGGGAGTAEDEDAGEPPQQIFSLIYPAGLNDDQLVSPAVRRALLARPRYLLEMVPAPSPPGARMQAPATPLPCEWLGCSRVAAAAAPDCPFEVCTAHKELVLAALADDDIASLKHSLRVGKSRHEAAAAKSAGDAALERSVLLPKLMKGKMLEAVHQAVSRLTQTSARPSASAAQRDAVGREKAQLEAEVAAMRAALDTEKTVSALARDLPRAVPSYRECCDLVQKISLYLEHEQMSPVLPASSHLSFAKRKEEAIRAASQRSGAGQPHHHHHHQQQHQSLYPHQEPPPPPTSNTKPKRARSAKYFSII